MSWRDEDYLFENRYAPLTTVLYFLRASPERLASLGEQYFRTWARGRWRVGSDRVPGGLEALLQGLPPLRIAATHFLFVPTASAWTALFSNSREGTEQSLPSLLAGQLRCGYLRVVDAPGVDEVRRAPTSMPGRMFDYSANLGDPSSASRAVDLLVEDRWEFDERGTPLPGEDTNVYRARRPRDRFPHRHLRTLCSLVGTQPFDEQFYVTDLAGTLRLTQELPLFDGDGLSLPEVQAQMQR